MNLAFTQFGEDMTNAYQMLLESDQQIRRDQPAAM